MAMAVNDTYLTAPEVAAMLRVRVSTVYTWAQHGRIPCLRVGGVIRFDRQELMTWARGVPSNKEVAVGG